jgi:hypothetical protein
MAHVQPGHVQARRHQPRDLLRAGRGGTQGAHNLRSAAHLCHPDPGSLAPLLAALGADVQIKPAAAAALVARLSGPNGSTLLR